MEEGRSAFKILTRIPAGKRRLGTPRRRWEENIRKDLKEMLVNMRVVSVQNIVYWRARVNAA